MTESYTIYAVRGHQRRRLACRSAQAALSHKDDLMTLGWAVSILDHTGMPISDARAFMRVEDEAEVLSDEAMTTPA